MGFQRPIPILRFILSIIFLQFNVIKCDITSIRIKGNSVIKSGKTALIQCEYEVTDEDTFAGVEWYKYKGKKKHVVYVYDLFTSNSRPPQKLDRMQMYIQSKKLGGLVTLAIRGFTLRDHGHYQCVIYQTEGMLMKSEKFPITNIDATCNNGIKKRIRKHQKKGLLFYSIDTIPGTEDGLIITYICDFLKKSETGPFIDEKCESGRWQFDKEEAPICETIKMCPLHFTKHMGQCRFFGPSYDYVLSKNVCQRYGGQMPILANKHEWDTGLWILNSIPKDYETHDFFLWVGLERKNHNRWEWVNGETLSTNEHWHNGFPKEGQDYTHFQYAFLNATTKKLKNMVSRHKQRSEYFGVDRKRRAFMLCSLDPNTKTTLTIKGVTRYQFYRVGESLTISIAGIFDAMAYQELLYTKIWPWEYQDFTTNIWTSTRISRIHNFDERAASATLVAVINVKTLDGILCRNLKAVGIKVIRNLYDNIDFLPKEAMPGSDCRVVKEYDEAKLRITLASKVSLAMRGEYIINAQHTSIKEKFYVDILDANGWTIWTSWSPCFKGKTTRHRKCSKYYALGQYRTEKCDYPFENKQQDC